MKILKKLGIPFNGSCVWFNKRWYNKLYAAKVARNLLRVYRHIEIIVLNALPIAFKYIWYNKIARKINCKIFHFG